MARTTDAERVLVELARRDGGACQDVALAALGQFGSDRAVATLTEIRGRHRGLAESAGG